MIDCARILVIALDVCRATVLDLLVYALFQGFQIAGVCSTRFAVVAGLLVHSEHTLPALEDA